MKISVVIVEDDKNYNNTLKRLIDYQPDLECTGQFFNGKSALENIPVLQPDVVIMDIHLHDFSGQEVIAKLKQNLPFTNFIMCTNFEDEENIFASLRCGAVGYLIKGESMEKIISSIKDAKNGGAPISNDIARKVLQYFQKQQSNKGILEVLTATEMSILALLSDGFLYKEIADKKNISIETVKKHVTNIYKKLKVNNKVEAINIFNKS